MREFSASTNDALTHPRRLTSEPPSVAMPCTSYLRQSRLPSARARFLIRAVEWIPRRPAACEVSPHSDGTRPGLRASRARSPRAGAQAR